MRLALCCALALMLAGCNIVYKVPTRQGNVIEQDKLERIEIGMTRSQVRFLLGTPLAASPFTDDRWDYLGYYRSPRGEEAKRIVSFHFEEDRLVRAEGIRPPSREDAQVIEPEGMRDDQAPVDAEQQEPPPEIMDSPLPGGRRT